MPEGVTDKDCDAPKKRFLGLNARVSEKNNETFNW